MSREPKIISEFSRYATKYKKYSTIQKEVADELLSYVAKKNYDFVVDIGSGDGHIYNGLKDKGVTVEKFMAFDASRAMLDMHPSSNDVIKKQGDFNSIKDLKSVGRADMLISSSALQWSKDFAETIKAISTISDRVYLAIFTSNTFRHMHNFAGISSPIHNQEHLMETIDKHLQTEMILRKYKLKFENKRDMFKYIKMSGVSGGEKMLSYQKSKRLLSSYPYDYLEFEVLFAVSK